MTRKELDKTINQLRSLNGNVIPVGETYEDTRRYNNLFVQSEFLLGMISEIKKASKYKDRSEFSMAKIGIKAEETIDVIKEIIN